MVEWVSHLEGRTKGGTVGQRPEEGMGSQHRVVGVRLQAEGKLEEDRLGAVVVGTGAVP